MLRRVSLPRLMTNGDRWPFFFSFAFEGIGVIWREGSPAGNYAVFVNVPGQRIDRDGAHVKGYSGRDPCCFPVKMIGTTSARQTNGTDSVI